MKRYSLLVPVIVLAMCASAAFAIFPGNNGKTFPNTVGDGTVGIQLLHGWSQGAEAWYHCFSSNNIRVAQTENLVLAPKLSSGALPFSSTMFVFTNFNNQGPAFTGSPVNGVYSSTWQIFYVTWRAGVTPWVVKDPLAAAGSFPGLPLAGVQADYQLFPPGQAPTQQPVIVDCTIFALGPLSNPWRQPTTLSPLRYRIRQGSFVNTYTKVLTIPYWNVYCQDPITKRIHVDRVVIPDASLPVLADLIGANVAPVMVIFPQADKGLINIFNWAQDRDPITPGIQPLKILTNQYPVLCDCPSSISWRNTNFDYSPIDQFALLNRVAPFSPEILFQTCSFIQAQVTAGNLLSVLFPTPPLPVPPTPVGYPPAGIATLYSLHAPVIGAGVL